MRKQNELDLVQLKEAEEINSDREVMPLLNIINQDGKYLNLLNLRADEHHFIQQIPAFFNETASSGYGLF